MRQNIGCSNAPVAQLDRVIGYEPIGQGFESLRVRHSFFFQIHAVAVFLTE